MSNNLFRKKAAKKVSSPEQLDEYIRVSNPSAWVVLTAFAVLLVGICVWGIFGRIDTTVSVAAVNENGTVICYVKETDRSKVSVGMPVEIGEKEFSVTEISNEPVQVDNSLKEYAKHVGKLNDGEWIYFVKTDCGDGADGEIFSAEIVVERINPLYFVTN